MLAQMIADVPVEQGTPMPTRIPGKAIARRVSAVPEERTVVYHSNVSGAPRFSYPSEWFAQHPGLKPQLSVPALPAGATLAQLRSSVGAKILAGGVPIPEAILYMETLMESEPQEVLAPWTSFGRTISDAAAPVHFRSLYNRVETQTVVDLMVGPPLGEQADLWICIYLASAYRVCLIQRPDYKTIVVGAINEHLRSNFAPANADIRNVSIHNGSWVKDRWFCALVALMDMWLQKFEKHRLAEARVSTITSRFRDCVALQDLVFIADLLGLDFKTASYWMWNPKIGDEFSRVSLTGEEIDEMDSYTPYMSDLGLCEKSPYSASVNPCLYFWTHIVGVSMGVPRSLNARIVGQIPVATLIQHALVCGFAFLSKVEASPQLTPTDVYIPIVPNVMPESLDGNDWFSWFKNHGFMLPPVLVTRMRAVWGGLAETQPKTIGRMAAEFIFPNDPAINLI